jgi:large repetitive protein
VSNHASTIAGVATGVAVFAACEAVTVGAGSIGCAMLAGAAGNAVSYAMDCSKDHSCSVGGAVAEIGEGAIMGALGEPVRWSV